jgi:hypothetical protein
MQQFECSSLNAAEHSIAMPGSQYAPPPNTHTHTPGITVKDEKDEIDLEVDVRWCGDANISLGIDLPLGG